MDIQVLWQAGDHLAAPGQYFSLDFHTISLPLSHLHGELRKARSSPGTACLGALQGGGADRHSKSREELSMGWKQNQAWGHVSFLCLHALPRSGVVSKQFRHEARFGSNTTSGLKSHLDLPLGSSSLAAQASPFPTPQILQTSHKTHKMMIKMDKAFRD